MTLDEYIGREIRLVKEERKPNAISVRFVQLHELAARTASEEEEYQMLYRLMHSRWRWLRASQDANAQTGRKKQPEDEDLK